MPAEELLELTISELAPKLKARKVSPIEVTEATLARAHRLQPTLNSFITILDEQAMAQAREHEGAIARGEYRGPLHGIPIGIKDNISTAGIRTTVGSKVLADYVPEEDAHVVALCKRAGAIILGKENLHEFAAGGTSTNSHYGTVHNPWGLNRVPGGSSGGSAANVAARVTFASLGTDLGGSVRMPASFCGVVGLKQTFGRVSQRGLLITSFNGDHIGPLTRSAQDSAILLQAIAGNDPLDPSTVPVPVPDYSAALELGLEGLKIGVPANHFFDLVEPELEAAVRGAIARLEELGAEVKEVTIPRLEYAATMRIASLAERVVTHEPYLREHRQDYEPDVLYPTLAGQFILAWDYVKALKVQRIMKEEFARVLQEVDFLATPTTPITAFPIGSKMVTLRGAEYPVGTGVIYSRNTLPINAVGLPAISVPCGLTKEGLPMGLQLIGRPFDEGLLFRVASCYEALSPMQEQRPRIMEAN